MSRLRLVLAAALICACVPVGTARAGFAPANDPIAGALQFRATGFASDAQGNTITAWNQQQTLMSSPEVQARRLSAGGTLGPVVDLAPGEIASEPRAAMTAAGRAFVAWEWEATEGANAGVKGRWVESDGTLGPLLTLIEGGVTEDAVDVHVVVDPAGVATVSWENEMPGTLAMRRVGPDSTLSSTVLDVSGGGGVTNHQIAALPNGSTVAVWRGNGTEKNVLTSALAFGLPEKISEDNNAGDNQIVVDSAGNGLVVWRENKGGEYSVQGRRLDPTGAVAGGVLTIDPAATGFVGTQVRPSADSAGDFLVTWNRQDALGDAILHARGVNSLGAFAGPEQPLSPGLFDATAQQSAIFDQGGGAVVWDRNDNSTRITLGRGIDPAALPTSGIEELFGDGIGSISVAGAPAAGIATFLIEYATSGASDAVVARRYLLPPRCTGSSATVVQGAPITIPSVCSGPAIESVQALTQPRHGRLTLGPGLAFSYVPDVGFDGGDGFTYAATNDGGTSAATTVTIAVGKETTKPKIQKLRYLRKGKKFRLVFSEPATAVVTLKQFVKGRNGKLRLRKLGTVSSKRAARRATIAVKGKLRKKVIAGSRFRAVAVATDTARNRSASKRLGFVIKG